MASPVTDAQKNALMAALREAFLILRDDKPFRHEENPAFGVLYETEDQYKQPGKLYSYRNSQIPGASLEVSTQDDPLDYSDDREKVSLVPYRIWLNFNSPLAGITPSMLRQELDLADYWMSTDGVRFNYNDMGPPTDPRLNTHAYRFRANGHADSRFAVNVDVSYIDPREGDPAGTPPRLWIIDITRAYPLLTPEMRKQKREEERLKKREKYGYMSLCTGGVCPETGYWEGWTKESGPTDILRVEKGQKFDVVRTVPLTTDRSSCPMVPGQWMWLCSLEEARGFQWKGFTLNG